MSTVGRASTSLISVKLTRGIASNAAERVKLGLVNEYLLRLGRPVGACCRFPICCLIFETRTRQVRSIKYMTGFYELSLGHNLWFINDGVLLGRLGCSRRPPVFSTSARRGVSLSVIALLRLLAHDSGVWNSLPADVQSAPSLATFRHLFRQS